MPNPPYSGLFLIVAENQDGGTAFAFIYNEIPEGQAMPPGLPGLEYNLKSSLNLEKTPPDRFLNRNFATRTALKNAFANLVDQTFPDTPA